MQHRSNSPIKTRVIAWTLVAAIFAFVAFRAWQAIEDGKVLGFALTLGIATLVTWRLNRNAAGAKGR